MQTLLENNGYPVLIVALFGILVVAVLAESAFPRRGEPKRLGYRWANNLGLWILDQINVGWVAAFAAVCVAWWTEGKNIGLIGSYDLSFWPCLLLAILTFELIAYFFHRALHTVPWLWRIHMVHHSDTDVDFTTTFRSHPLELLTIAPVMVAIVVLLGFPAIVMVAYLLLRQTINIFAHSNIKIPEPMDRILRHFIVTPDFHRLHHCSDRRFTDSNYCVAFPVYDYLFRTATNRPFRDQAAIQLGLEYFRDPADSRIDRLLLMPFRRQPRYTRELDSLAPATNPTVMHGS